jgi:uncharacterized protein YebE (UPF0316 family)
MDYIYSAAVVSILFIIFKFLETRLILKETVNLKQLVIDGILVYLSVIVGHFINEQLVKQTTSLGQAPVFIDNPKF